MELETILKEFSFGKKIKILEIVSSGTSRKCEILEEMSIVKSTVEVSLRFLVDEGFLRKRAIKNTGYRWKVSYSITKKGKDLLTLFKQIKRTCNEGKLFKAGKG